jgi:tRNA A-37 threonylcarbamoyl transferase component Bud32
MAERGEDPSSDPFADTAADSVPGGKKRRGVHTGDVLGRYELGDEVGEGGMATVFRARDRELRRDVAVKVLFPHLARRPEVVRRFQREARAAATLEHVNILRVYDVGGGDDTDDDPPFIVMELIRGRALLGEIEQRGPMFAEVAACAGALLADALAAAHHAGIVHRDVKPSNVLVSHDGRLLLADFGVARLETEDSLITRTGAVLGTPAYMSPEQAAGDTATARSDLYSLGATLYQLATGALPFTGTQAKVLAQVAGGSVVPAVKRRAEVGPELSGVIDRLMSVDPDARPARASEVATELRAIATAAGFGEPADELAAYFADPAAFVAGKTPGVVRAIVAAGERAVADGKLPRAMALAERASALTPDEPAVIALVRTVTEGGRASRRRRRLAVGALGALAVAGAAVGAMALSSKSSSSVSSLSGVIVVADATPVVIGSGSAAEPHAIEVAPPPRAPPLDAAVATHVIVARDAMVVPIDAALVDDDLPHDAAVIPADADAPGTIVVTSDVWCDVTVDRVAAGRKNPGPALTIHVAAGHHVVTCAQSGTGRSWTREVDVPPGGSAPADGTLLADVTITSEIDAKLDGAPLGPGAHVVVKPGYHDIESHGATHHAHIRMTCVIRDRPELDCYP